MFFRGKFCDVISPKTESLARLKLNIRDAFIAIGSHAKFHFNRLMITLIFGIRVCEAPLPLARRTTEKAGPDRVKQKKGGQGDPVVKRKISIQMDSRLTEFQ